MYGVDYSVYQELPIEKLVPLVKRAGQILIRYYGRVPTAYKYEGDFGADSVVTKADLAVERFLARALKVRFPNFGFYGEERVRRELRADYLWHLDPLDGTFNFVREIPLFGISLGLTHQGIPVAGILHFPLLKLTMWAERGRGSYANGKRIKVSRRPLPHALYWAGGYCKRKLGLVPKLLSRVGAVKIIDASSFALAQIAQGHSELYVLPNVPHDVVAGAVAIMEAGGRVTDQSGRPLTTRSKVIVATNGRIHQQVLGLLKGVKV